MHPATTEATAGHVSAEVVNWPRPTPSPGAHLRSLAGPAERTRSPLLSLVERLNSHAGPPAVGSDRTGPLDLA